MPICPRPDPQRVLALLDDCGLPSSDLGAGHFDGFLAWGEAHRPDGVVGLEVHGDCGLLRSLAVTRRARGAGIGTALVQAIEDRARARGVRRLFLLTETAEAFFAAQGYVGIPREAVAPEIQGTREFSSLCPDSATVMCKDLDPGPTAAGA